MQDIAIVYMVAGLSSRFGGKIKQFAKIGPNNETLIEYSLNQAIAAGFTKIIFIVGEKTQEPFKRMFKQSYKGVPVYYSFQEFDSIRRDKPWGTVDALCSAKDLLDCKFVVCNGDDIYGESSFKLLAEHLKNKTTDATVGYKIKNVLSEHGGVNRGKFEATSDNIVKSIKEIFNITNLNFKEKELSEDSSCSMNIFALQPETLQKLNQILIKFKQINKTDRKIECLLPNELNRLIQEQEITMQVYPTDEKWFGVTYPEDEENVKRELANNFRINI